MSVDEERLKELDAVIEVASKKWKQLDEEFGYASSEIKSCKIQEAIKEAAEKWKEAYNERYWLLQNMEKGILK